MSKYIRVHIMDGTVWDIPADRIAADRAKYYAKRDADHGYGNYEIIYNEEYAYALKRDDELLDWLANNMNWEDVSDVAKEVPQKRYFDKKVYDDGISNGRKEVIEA